MELKQRLGNTGHTSCARVSDLGHDSIAQAPAIRAAAVKAAADKAAAEKAAAEMAAAEKAATVKAVAEKAAAEQVGPLQILAPWFEASGLHTADAPQLGCILDLSFLRGANRQQSSSHF